MAPQFINYGGTTQSSQRTELFVPWANDWVTGDYCVMIVQIQNWFATITPSDPNWTQIYEGELPSSGGRQWVGFRLMLDGANPSYSHWTASSSSAWAAGHAYYRGEEISLNTFQSAEGLAVPQMLVNNSTRVSMLCGTQLNPPLVAPAESTFRGSERSGIADNNPQTMIADEAFSEGLTPPRVFTGGDPVRSRTTGIALQTPFTPPSYINGLHPIAAGIGGAQPSLHEIEDGVY